jgi:hypothetical protein
MPHGELQFQRSSACDRREHFRSLCQPATIIQEKVRLDSSREKHGAYRRRFNKIALPVRELQDQLMMYCTVPVDVDEI